MSNCLFWSEIIYLTIPVVFKGCFGDVWMYVMYIYFLKNHEELRNQIKHLRILINSIYILVLILRCPMFFIIQKHTKQSWPELMLYAASCLIFSLCV